MSWLRRNRSALIILTIAIIFVVIGVWRGEIAVVLRKAVNICMECIGLG